MIDKLVASQSQTYVQDTHTYSIIRKFEFHLKALTTNFGGGWGLVTFWRDFAACDLLLTFINMTKVLSWNQVLSILALRCYLNIFTLIYILKYILSNNKYKKSHISGNSNQHRLTLWILYIYVYIERVCFVGRICKCLPLKLSKHNLPQIP